ncbi:MAG: NADH-quinone oxidoreductase subunit NuoE [Acidobacteria bacterium]|nr:NADH-quinone oxidoreductase subunit NuoE [Acidobacteriota bacterium]
MEATRPFDFANLHFKGEGGTLIPLLQKVQTEEGYISKDRIEEIHRKTGVPLSHIFGVATFYAQFRLRPVGRNIIKVCHGTACHVAGANAISASLKDILQIGDGETTPDRAFTVETVSCLGCCSLAPVIMVNKDTHGNLAPADLRKALAPYRSGKA